MDTTNSNNVFSDNNGRGSLESPIELPVPESRKCLLCDEYYIDFHVCRVLEDGSLSHFCYICGEEFNFEHDCRKKILCRCKSICLHSQSYQTLVNMSTETLNVAVEDRFDRGGTQRQTCSLKRTARVTKRKFNKSVAEAQMFTVNHKMDPVVLDTLEKLCKNIQDVSLDFKELKSGDIARKFLSGFAEEVAIPAVEILAATYVIVSFINKPCKINAACLAVFLSYIVYKRGSQLLDYPAMLTEICSKFQSDKAISQMDTADFSAISTFLGICIHAYLVNDSPSSSMIKKIQTFMSGLQFNSNSADFTMKFVVAIVEKIVNFFRENFFNLPHLTLIKNIDEDVQRIIEDCSLIQEEYRNGRFKINIENSHSLINLSHRLRELISKYGNMKDKSGTKTQLMMLYSELEALKNKFVQANIPLSGVKFTPIFIVLEGSSQIGKSHMMYPFCCELGIRCLPMVEAKRLVANHNAFIYTRNHETVYWDGYIGQFFCIVDDLGQVVSQAGDKDSEWMNIIRMVSSFPFMLHMADLLSKGNTFFSSKFVVATTNLYNYNIESLSYPKAITERMHLRAHVVPAKKYRTEESSKFEDLKGFALDKTKTNGIVDLSVYEFHVRDKNGNYTGEVLDYDSFLLRCESLYKGHSENHENYTLAIEDIKKRAFEKRFGPISQMDSEIFFDASDKTPVELMSLWLSKLSEDQKLTFSQCVAAKCPGLELEDHGEILVRSVELVQNGIYILEDNSFEDVCRWINNSPVYTTSFKTSFFDNAISILSSVRRGVTEAVDSFFSNNPNLNTRIVKILQAVAVASAVISIPTLLSYFGASAESQSSSRNKPKEKISKDKIKRRIEKAKIKMENSAVSQGATAHDDSMYNISTKVVKRNCYELWLPGANRLAGSCTFLKDRLMIINLHYVLNIAEMIEHDPSLGSKNITLKKCFSDVTFSFPVAEILNFVSTDELENNDLALLYLDGYNIPCHVDITKYFIDERTLAKNRDMYALLVKPRIRNTESYFSPFTQITNKEVYNATIDETYTILKAYQYNVPNRVGDCGSILFLFDSTTGCQKILGFHDGGVPDAGIGFASAVFKESILEALQKFPNLITKEIEADSVSQGDFTPVPYKFQPLYNIKKKVNLPLFSRIIPSVLHSKWGKSKETPAKLTTFNNGEQTVDPYKTAMLKYDAQDIIISKHLLELTRLSLMSDMDASSSFPDTKRIFTKHEAFAGIPGTSFGSVPRSTSEGYPGVLDLDPKNPGKTKYFGKDGDFDFNSEHCIELFHLMDDIIDKCKKGFLPEIVFVDYLKDETRPIEKVLQGKTRIISCSPIAYTGLVRQYFGAYLMWLNDNKIRNGSAVCVNPYSSEWQMIVNSLHRIGKSIGAGDYSNFDGCQLPQIQRTLVQTINEWYGDSDENQRIRRILFEVIINSRHIYGNSIYEWFGSSPSGQPLTTALNNHYNHMLFRLCWLDAHNYEPISLLSFKKNVYLITLGDDNLYSISDEYKDKFNEMFLAQTMCKFGAKYTNETKTQSTVKYRDITEVTFLKRGFRFEPLMGRYVAPLCMDTILEMPYWTKNNTLKDTIVKDTSNSAILELSLHGKKEYENWSNIIYNEAHKLNIQLNKPPFFFALNEICSTDCEF